MAQDAEQFAEAYAVQVVLAEKLTGDPTDPVHEEPDPEVRSLVAILVNHGRYTIIRVEAQFRLAAGRGSLVRPHRTELLTSYPDLGQRLRAGLSGAPEHNPYAGRLSPWDTGMRIESARMAAKLIQGAYPVVRWTDRLAHGGSTGRARSGRAPRTLSGCRSKSLLSRRTSA